MSLSSVENPSPGHSAMKETPEPEVSFTLRKDEGAMMPSTSTPVRLKQPEASFTIPKEAFPPEGDTVIFPTCTPVQPKQLTGLDRTLGPSEQAAIYVELNALRQERDDLREQLNGTQRLLSTGPMRSDCIKGDDKRARYYR